MAQGADMYMELQPAMQPAVLLRASITHTQQVCFLMFQDQHYLPTGQQAGIAPTTHSMPPPSTAVPMRASQISASQHAPTSPASRSQITSAPLARVTHLSALHEAPSWAKLRWCTMVLTRVALAVAKAQASRASTSRDACRGGGAHDTQAAVRDSSTEHCQCWHVQQFVACLAA
jgi:hypothetical protein